MELSCKICAAGGCFLIYICFGIRTNPSAAISIAAVSLVCDATMACYHTLASHQTICPELDNSLA